MIIIILTISHYCINLLKIIVIAITNFGNTMQNMLIMQTNSATVIALCMKGNCL